MIQVLLLEHHSRVFERWVRQSSDDHSSSIVVRKIQTFRNLRQNGSEQLQNRVRS
jgi:hypothetical protein